MPYQPVNQAGADYSYYSTLDNLTQNDWNTYATANGGLQDIYRDVSTNPYNASAQASTDRAAGAAANSGNQDLAMGGQAAASGNADIAAANSLTGYVPAIQAYGFDPQGDNYNWGLRGATDAQAIANAQSGIAGSPFGASTVGDAGAAFTRQWNADKQGRALQALQALQTLFGAQSNLRAAGTGQFGQASDLNMTGSQALADSATMSQQQWMQRNNNTLLALQALIQGNGAAEQPLQNDVSGYGNYLGLGQSATQIADNATKINNSRNNGFLGGLGKIFGAAVSLIPGVGPLAGAAIGAASGALSDAGSAGGSSDASAGMAA